MGSEPKTIGAVERSIGILEFIGDHGPVGVSEIATDLSLSKSTVYTHLNTLQQNGYLTKTDGRYDLSCAVLSLGTSVQNRSRLYQKGKQQIDRLSAQTDERANLVIEENGLGTCLYAANPEKTTDVSMSVGEQHYMHGTATGKAILAHLPRLEVEQIIERHGLPKRTEQTITDREALFEELADVRERGIAFDRQETIDGLYCISAPIVVHDEVIGSLSVSGPVSQFEEPARNEELVQAVEESANIISLQFVFSTQI